MKNATKILFSMIIFSAPQLLFASSIKQLDIPELLKLSEIVFEGEVIKTEARWNDTQTDIYTEITFRVDDVVIGTYLRTNLVLSFVGGTVDQTTVSIAGSKMPTLNESGVYFVGSTTKKLVNPIVGWAQGHFLTQQDETGTKRVMTHNKTPVAGLDMSQKKLNSISDDFVTGLKLANSNKVSSAMKLDDFKTLLKKQVSSVGER